jgi:AAA lid domain
LKIAWNSEKDDDLAKDYIIKLGKFLAKIRGHVETWSSKGTGHAHEYTEYSYGFTQSEDPARASTQLYNLARGHALLRGRNYITIDDIPVAVKVVLSTASIERVAILDLLLCKKQSITLSGITNVLPMSKSTALKAMTALAALKVVNMEDTVVGGNFTKQITLRDEFSWLFSDEFDKLRQGFDPVDSSEYDNIEEELDQQTSSSDQTVNGDDLSANPVSSSCLQGSIALCIDGR